MTVLPKLVFALPLSLVASPLVKPALHQWHFTLGSQAEGGSYRSISHHQSGVAGTASDITGGLVGLGLSQSAGYGRWFYFQTMESAAVSLGTSIVEDDTRGQDVRASSSIFIDLDGRAYFPLALSNRHAITLLPNVGFAAHFFTMNAKETFNTGRVSRSFKRYQSKTYGPLIGLALGMDVTEQFSFRFNMAFEFPRYEGRSKQDFDSSTLSDWESLRMHRVALHSRLDVSYQLRELLSLTGAIDYLQYGVLDRVGDQHNPTIGFLSRTKFSCGVRWQW